MEEIIVLTNYDHSFTLKANKNGCKEELWKKLNSAYFIRYQEDDNDLLLINETKIIDEYGEDQYQKILEKIKDKQGVGEMNLS